MRRLRTRIKEQSEQKRTGMPKKIHNFYRINEKRRSRRLDLS